MTTQEVPTNPVPGNTERIRMLIDGGWRQGATEGETTDPYRGDVVSVVPETTPDEVDAALAAAVRAKPRAEAMPAPARARVLHAVADSLIDSAEELARCMTLETGKAIKDSRLEVRRSGETLHLSAEEAGRIEGEHVPLDATEMGFGKTAMLLRFPVGVVAAITPFNAPLNLACHKIGPALAAGNTVVLKASPQAPLVVHRLAELFAAAGLPAGFLNTVYGHEAGPALVRDPRVDFISFTGSTKAGTEVRANSGLRRVALELGGLGPVIVHDDADTEQAGGLCARNAMRLSGQSCVSVQNIHAHRAVYDQFIDLLKTEVESLKIGDPLDEATDVGTLIDERAADRVEATVGAAVRDGADVVVGGQRLGPTAYSPTVLTGVKPVMSVVCEEVFGPVVTVRPYDDIEDVFAEISASPLGLQCGVFTTNLKTAMRAAKGIRCGGIILNGTSTWRTDQLAYGGIKNSGIGREGPRYAIREMTEQRLVVFDA